PCRARHRVRTPRTRHPLPWSPLVPCGLGLACWSPNRAPTRLPSCRRLPHARVAHRSALLRPQGLGLAHARPNRALSSARPRYRPVRARPRHLHGCCPRSTPPYSSRVCLPARAYRRRLYPDRLSRARVHPRFPAYRRPPQLGYLLRMI
ncbi:Unknown protein, partial [Striga hermonthica]